MTVPGFPNFLLLERRAATIECHPEVHAEYRRDTDEANRRMAWGASTVNSWSKSASGRVTQNWPSTSLEFWQRTRNPTPDDYVIITSDRANGEFGAEPGSQHTMA